MPGYTCPIRERMLYSSCKASLLDLIQSLGITLDKKVSQKYKTKNMLKDFLSITCDVVFNTYLFFFF